MPRIAIVEDNSSDRQLLKQSLAAPAFRIIGQFETAERLAFTSDELLTAKEIAAKLKRHLNYVYAMKERGFLMPGGVATLAEARWWLAGNQAPRSKKPLATP